MANRYYITTPIYYVNDAPHLGHAYTTIAADAIARFQRMNGCDTRFLTGTDEHGQKVEETAAKQGLKPKELADRVVGRFQATWKNLNISHDDFIRTTEPRHAEVVAEMWRRMEKAGDIYLHFYAGWYCVSCEAFYPDTQLVDGKLCPVHKSEARWVEEPSYFFRMSKYQDALLAHFEKHPDFVQPDNYRREILSFIKGGLRDLSVSRTTFSWGIPVPSDPKHVIYVWIDALTNYMSALGLPGSDNYKRYWPANCHLIGKDILRFHAVYWPCMLLSAGLPLPEQVYVHGWWTLRGEKISKSMPATRVDPNQLAADVGEDALRYFLMREIPLGNDGDFTYEAFLGRINADLANDIGNLFSRSVAMAQKFVDGKTPAASSKHDVGPHRELRLLAQKITGETRQQLGKKEISRALETIWQLIREGNRYVDVMQPWAMAKVQEKKEELDHTIHMLLATSALVARLVYPVMPRTAAEMLERLGVADVPAKFSEWPTGELGAELTTGARIAVAAPLFPRIEPARAAELLSRWLPVDSAAPVAATATPPAAAAKSAEPSAAGGEVTIEEFARFDLRTARIESAEPVPKAQKLLRITLSLGNGETRQVVAGIAEAYKPEELAGRTVIFLANLKPAIIRSVRSEGMILAVGDKRVLALSAVDRDVPPGEKVR